MTTAIFRRHSIPQQTHALSGNKKKTPQPPAQQRDALLLLLLLLFELGLNKAAMKGWSERDDVGLMAGKNVLC